MNDDIDYTKYLSIPYKSRGRDWDGVDCFGLVYLFYREELDIELDEKWYEHDWWKKDCENPDFETQAEGEGFFEVETREKFDLIFFRVKSQVVNHIGIYTGDNKILHAKDGQMVYHDELSRGMGKLSHSTWRHRKLAR